MSSNANDPITGLLERSGFEPRDLGEEGTQWGLSPPGTCRHVYVRILQILHGSEQPMYSIDVEEWRGGEGYEDTPLRTADSSEVLAAIPRWVEWAMEPFTPSWWERLRTRLGLP